MQDTGNGFRRRQVPAGQPRLAGEPQGERVPCPELSDGRNRMGSSTPATRSNSSTSSSPSGPSGNTSSPPRRPRSTAHSSMGGSRPATTSRTARPALGKPVVAQPGVGDPEQLVGVADGDDRWSGRIVVVECGRRGRVERVEQSSVRRFDGAAVDRDDGCAAIAAHPGEFVQQGRLSDAGHAVHEAPARGPSSSRTRSSAPSSRDRPTIGERPVQPASAPS